MRVCVGSLWCVCVGGWGCVCGVCVCVCEQVTFLGGVYVEGCVELCACFLVCVEPWWCVVDFSGVSKKGCQVVRCIRGCIAKFVFVCVWMLYLCLSRFGVSGGRGVYGALMWGVWGCVCVCIHVLGSSFFSCGEGWVGGWYVSSYLSI